MTIWVSMPTTQPTISATIQLLCLFVKLLSPLEKSHSSSQKKRTRTFFPKLAPATTWFHFAMQGRPFLLSAPKWSSPREALSPLLPEKKEKSSIGLTAELGEYLFVLLSLVIAVFSSALPEIASQPLPAKLPKATTLGKNKCLREGKLPGENDAGRVGQAGRRQNQPDPQPERPTC